VSLLLDSHALIWWLEDTELDADVKARIAATDELVAVSAASVWELHIRRANGKMRFDDSLVDVVAEGGFEALAMTPSHAERAAELPRHHHDPFDRMLIAQAQIEGLVVVTRDAVFEQYEVPVLRC